MRVALCSIIAVWLSTPYRVGCECGGAANIVTDAGTAQPDASMEFTIDSGMVFFDAGVPSEDSGTADDAGVIDAGGPAPEIPLGIWASQLPVGQCPPAPTIIVDTTFGGLDAGLGADGGMRTSFLLAWETAVNRPGPDTITFDPAVFPVDTPQRVRFVAGVQFSQGMQAICIDGRDRGVEFEWQTSSYSQALAIWHFVNTGLQIGVTLVNPPSEQLVSVNSQVAGCRYSTDGHDGGGAGRFWSVELSQNARFGPGNILGGHIRSFGGAAAVPQVTGNYFGYDPLTHVSLRTASIDVRETTHIDHNVFSGGQAIFGASCFASTRPVVVESNFLGWLPDGGLIPPAAMLIDQGCATTPWFLGPANKVRQSASAISSFGAPIRLTQNEFDQAPGLHYPLPFPVSPPTPTITGLDGGMLSGTCGAPGEIEVFANVSQYLGTTSCTTSWVFDAGTFQRSALFVTFTQADGGRSTGYVQ